VKKDTKVKGKSKKVKVREGKGLGAIGKEKGER
jgi:hypothetical protein